jgi:hypothetical protein
MKVQTYTNLDGLTVAPNSVNYASWLAEKGYTQVIPLRGTVGYSELAMFTRNSERVGIVAFVKPDPQYGYAHVLLDNGFYLDGCFSVNDDGTFSVS